MAVPLTPTQRSRLQAAADHASELTRKGTAFDPADVIGVLVARHGGRFVPNHNNTNQLRIAGVLATCTWSKSEGLLSAWKNRAALRLMEPPGGFGSER